MIYSIVAIALGSALGGLLRWFFSENLNRLFPIIPPGTLVANLLGGYLIGLAMAFFSGHPEWPPQWRLMVMTGFLGGLTTFSTFSLETANLLQQGRILWALGIIAVHVVGSLLMTFLGIATLQGLKQF